MKKQKEAYFKGLSPIERQTALKENAVESYTKSVVRNFSEDDLSEMKDRLSETCINLNDVELEKKDLNAEINARIKAIKVQRGTLLRDLKNKYYENQETVFDIDDQEEGIMYTFDQEGNVLSTRKLTPKERQTNIKSLNTKTA